MFMILNLNTIAFIPRAYIRITVPSTSRQDIRSQRATTHTRPDIRSPFPVFLLRALQSRLALLIARRMSLAQHILDSRACTRRAVRRWFECSVG
tara:strand:+ start:1110 stop:1391 length:282 start_codon:yes stop_codon:yes gene_type:complete